MRTSRNLKRLSVYLLHTDGNVALVQSPERPQKIGCRLKIGWAIAIFGFYMMFGHNKEWKTTINPQTGKDGEQE